MSKGVEPRKNVWLRLPDRGAGVFTALDFADFQGLAFHRQVDFDVAVGGRRAGMSPPSGDHVEFDARLQQVHGRGVPQRMGGNPAFLQFRHRNAGIGDLAL